MNQPSADPDEPWELRMAARLGGLGGPPPAASPLRERFAQVSRLGAGGMGEVLRAHDHALGRDVAIKLLPGGGGAKLRERLAREAQALARVSHPNVVAVHDLVYHEGSWLLVLDLAEGENLGEHLTHGPLSPDEAARIAHGIAAGLSALHAQGVVHRDVKPTNVMLRPDGQPLLLDLGVSKLLDEARQLTGTGHSVGTPGYMAPEQIADAKRVDERADLYGLGATLYHMLTGEPPLKGEGLEEVLFRAMSEPPKPPHTLAPAVDRYLSAICMRCLEKSPEQRYANARELRAELERHARGERPGAFPWRWIVRVLVIGAILVGLWILLHTPSAPPAEPGVELRELTSAARELLRQPRELKVDRTQIVALAEALPADARGPGADRVRALAGLLALAEGDEAAAQEALAAIEARSTAAGRALSAALEGDAAGLSAAIGAGLVRLDLRGWRASARLGQPLTPSEASEVLADLNALEAARALSEAERTQRVRALLASGEAARAAEALGAIAEPAPDLRWAVALSQVEAALDEAPAEALKQVQGLPAEGGDPDRRAALAALSLTRCLELAERAEDKGLQPETLAREEAYLRLRELLAPTSAVPKPLLRALRAQLTPLTFSEDRLGVALALADAVPDDPEVQRDVGGLVSQVRSNKRQRLAPALRRAAELHPDPIQRDRMQVLLCVTLADSKRAVRAEEVLERSAPLLERLDDPLRQYMLIYARGRAFEHLGRFEEALASYDETVAARDLADPYASRGLLLQRMNRPERAMADLVRYLELETRSNARQKDALVAIWELAREHSLEAAAIPGFVRETQRRPKRAGWRIRLAWLQLRAGEPEAAAETLRAAPSLGDDPRTQALADEHAALTESFDAERLGRLVEALEALRGDDDAP